MQLNCQLVNSSISIHSIYRRLPIVLPIKDKVHILCIRMLSIYIKRTVKYSLRLVPGVGRRIRNPKLGQEPCQVIDFFPLLLHFLSTFHCMPVCFAAPLKNSSIAIIFFRKNYLVKHSSKERQSSYCVLVIQSFNLFLPHILLNLQSILLQ
jgi:hypothetical protein